jgi:hypothetical protein
MSAEEIGEVREPWTGLRDEAIPEQITIQIHASVHSQSSSNVQASSHHDPILTSIFAQYAESQKFRKGQHTGGVVLNLDRAPGAVA